MRRLIFHKETLINVGCCNHADEWELENNVIPNYGGSNDDYIFIDTDVEYPSLKKENGKFKVVESERGLKVKLFSEVNSIEITNEEILDVLVDNGLELKGTLKDKYDKIKSLSVL